jgi:hypothetical protein
MFVTFIWEVPGLSLGWDIDCVEVLHACPYSLQQIPGILGLPSIPVLFQIRYLLSSIGLILHVPMSLNKLQLN